MSDLTYADVERTLRGLGFTSWEDAQTQTRVWEHQATGAEIYLPISPPDQEVHPRHLKVIQMTLDTYGLPDPFAAGTEPRQFVAVADSGNPICDCLGFAVPRDASRSAYGCRRSGGNRTGRSRA